MSGQLSIFDILESEPVYVLRVWFKHFNGTPHYFDYELPNDNPREILSIVHKCREEKKGTDFYFQTFEVIKL